MRSFGREHRAQATVSIPTVCSFANSCSSVPSLTARQQKSFTPQTPGSSATTVARRSFSGPLMLTTCRRSRSRWSSASVGPRGLRPDPHQAPPHWRAGGLRARAWPPQARIASWVRAAEQGTRRLSCVGDRPGPRALSPALLVTWTKSACQTFARSQCHESHGLNASLKH
jgi:hypothetical protein